MTYIVNNAGRVTLPAVSVFWWDSEFQQQRNLVLPERSWQVSHTFASFVEQYKVLLAGLAVIVVVVILSTALLYRYVKTRPKSKWLCLAQAIYKKDIPLFENSIYLVLLEHFQSRVLTPRVETVEGIEVIWQRYKKSPEHEKLREGEYSRLVLFKVLIAFLLSAQSAGLNR